MATGDKNFVYSKRDLMVVGVAVAIVVALVGLGFGLANGAPTSSTEYPPEFTLTSYERALEILKNSPVIDGWERDLPTTTTIITLKWKLKKIKWAKQGLFLFIFVLFTIAKANLTIIDKTKMVCMGLEPGRQDGRRCSMPAPQFYNIIIFIFNG